MKKIICLVLLFSISLISIVGCMDQNEDDSPSSNNAESKDIDDVSDKMSITDFDTDLISYISEHKEGNYMISPLSFRYALGLLLAGAEGETKTELLNALGVESVDEFAKYCVLFNGFVNRFDEELEKQTDEIKTYIKKGYAAEEDIPYRALRVANSIWKREDISESFKESYTDYIEKKFSAEYCSFNYDNAVSLINNWANEKTEGMIDRLLPDNYDTSNLAIVLMNALYFKDSWCEAFSESSTEDDIFTKADGSEITKTFMNQKNDYLYYSDSESQLVILPMEGDVYMAFVIGSTSNLDEKISKAESRSVKVKIPKIDLETSLDNKEFIGFLSDHGVTKAFNSSADFSAMIDREVYVGDIIQKTKIKLDEDGVEAAAVTAIMMLESCCPVEEQKPVEFNADEPFSFFIYTTANDTTAIMFAGEIVE